MIVDGIKNFLSFEVVQILEVLGQDLELYKGVF